MRRSPLHEDAQRRLDARIHALYRIVDAEVPEGDDADFVDLMNLRCECDAEAQRLVRILRTYALREPEVAA